MWPSFRYKTAMTSWHVRSLVLWMWCLASIVGASWLLITTSCIRVKHTSKRTPGYSSPYVSEKMLLHQLTSSVTSDFHMPVCVVPTGNLSHSGFNILYVAYRIYPHIWHQSCILSQNRPDGSRSRAKKNVCQTPK